MCVSGAGVELTRVTLEVVDGDFVNIESSDVDGSTVGVGWTIG